MPAQELIHKQPIYRELMTCMEEEIVTRDT